MSDFGTASFGTGPFGTGNDLLIPIPNPTGLGYGGDAFGFGPYGGSSTTIPAPAVPVSSGYGGDAFGLGPYGSVADWTPPSLSSAISLDGFHIEVFFSEPMTPNANLLDPSNYSLDPIAYAAPSLVTEVEVGIQGVYGPLSVILTHTGTTLGGHYEVSATGIQDLGGANIEWNGQNKADLLCKGEPPSFVVDPISGTELLLEFDHDILTETDFSPGIEDLNSYKSETDYPVDLIFQTVHHPYLGDSSKVLLDVVGMTSTEYGLILGPATALNYEATALPSDEGILAFEVGTGSSQIQGGLSMSAQSPNGYGWEFQDTSGKLIPNSSYRLDFVFDTTDTTISSLLTKGKVFTIVIEDGGVKIQFDFRLTVSGQKLTVSSGSYSNEISCTFLFSEITLSWVRNQKADSYSLLVNGSPLLTTSLASIDGVSLSNPGIQFFINTESLFDIIDFKVKSVSITSSQTIFSAAWNFLHNQIAYFIGNGANTKDHLLTKKGPLVKDWGNATPATKQDVKVRINGVEVEVADVNPYVGKIYTAIPIPLTPPGTFTVHIDYQWMHNPIFPFAGLNTEGLVLNKFDPTPPIPIGNHLNYPTPHFFEPILGEFHRFSYGLSLNKVQVRQPFQKSSRFIAFQKQYTAALNSPSSLLLNSNPHVIKKPSQREETKGSTVFYEGRVDPTEANPSWTLVGMSGVIEGNDEAVSSSGDAETFLVLDTSSGSFGAGEPSFYVRSERIPHSSTMIMVTRFVVTDDVPMHRDGVFTGVGFGFHDQNHLYLVGALQVNELQHIGMLVEPAYPELLSSWKLALSTSITIINGDTFVSTHLPRMVRERILGDDPVRFQILEGSQAGVYEITGYVAQSDGTYTVSVMPDFPTSPEVFGGNEAEVYFEIRWDGDNDRNRPLTYRLVVQKDEKKAPEGWADLYVGGSLSGKALELRGVPRFAIPPEGSLLFPKQSDCEFFWGSLSRPAMNSSLWSFVRYGVQPGDNMVYSDGIEVETDMSLLPELDHENIWFVTQEFGSREIDSSNRLLLRSTSSSDQPNVANLDLTVGYARFEPFFHRKVSCDLVATFQVDSGSLGAGDASIVIEDGQRKVEISTLLYEKSLQERRLVSLQNVSLSGLLLPEQQGWAKGGSGAATAHVQGQRIQLAQRVGQTLTYSLDSFQGPSTTDDRICNVRFRVLSVDGPNDTGIFFGFGVGPIGAQYGIGARLKQGNKIELYSLATNVSVSEFDWAWDDQQIHNLRVLADYVNNVVSLILDDQFVGTAVITDFAFHLDLAATFGLAAIDVASEVEIEDFSVVEMPPSSVKRTLGIYLGGDRDSIDSWKIPRLDGNDALSNSNLSAQVKEIDWRLPTKLRVHRDPTWGVIVQFPDLGLPPFYTGKYSTQNLIPSSGWISVEYPKLPLLSERESFGKFAFGSLDSRSISQQRWGYLKYRIFSWPGEDQLAPQFNVLNRANVITSGEWINDRKIETVTVLSENSTTIRLHSSNMFASRVFSFSYVNLAGKTVVFYPDSFTFDASTQTITIVSETNLGYQPSQDLPDLVDSGVDNPSLNDPNWPFEDQSEVFDPDGENPFLPSPPRLPEPVRVPVTINFSAGPPYTKEYICSQPFSESVTLLNEGTPDMTRNLICNEESQVMPCQYDQVEFCEDTRGEPGFLSPFCDETILVGYPGLDGSQEGDIGNGLIYFDISPA